MQYDAMQCNATYHVELQYTSLILPTLSLLLLLLVVATIVIISKLLLPQLVLTLFWYVFALLSSLLLSYTVPHYTLLCCIVLYCSYWNVLDCTTALYSFVLHCSALHYIVLLCNTLCYTTMYCNALYCAKLSQSTPRDSVRSFVELSCLIKNSAETDCAFAREASDG